MNKDYRSCQSYSDIINTYVDSENENYNDYDAESIKKEIEKEVQLFLRSEKIKKIGNENKKRFRK